MCMASFNFCLYPAFPFYLTGNFAGMEDSDRLLLHLANSLGYAKEEDQHPMSKPRRGNHMIWKGYRKRAVSCRN